jgi:K+ transport systems, NAD-binding component
MATTRKQFAVIGLGRFGQSVCRTLHDHGHDVLAMDQSEELTRDVHAEGLATHVIQADSTEIQALQEVDIHEYDTVVVAIGSDLEASVLTVLNLLDLGVRNIVAKASYDRHGQVLERVGGSAIRVVYPERQMGERIANSISEADVLETIELSPDFSITEIHPPKAWVGKSLAEVELRPRYGVTVIAIKSGHDLKISPPGTERFHAGDTITLVGPNDRLDELRRLSS